MSAAVSVSLLAHGLHVAMVLLGLWGLAALLLPHALVRHGINPHPVADVHSQRVAALRLAVAAGAPGISPTGEDLVPLQRRHPSAVAVPLALVASAAAASIHAAVIPAHLRDQVAAGMFFVVVTAAQTAWAIAAQRPTRGLLYVGILGNLAVLTVWLLSRTTGLPLGMSPHPESIGAWDAVATLCQLVVVIACAQSLRAGVPSRCPSWFEWHASARTAVGAAAFTIAMLILLGGHP